MNFLKFYTFLPVCLLGISTISAQSILEQYYAGNKDSLSKDAAKLISAPEPTFKQANQTTELSTESPANKSFEQIYKSQSRYFTVRDNKKIFAYRFSKKSQNTIILLHGVKSNAALYNQTAGLLQKAIHDEIYAIDLRGHGQSTGNSGDVDYINQYVDDLADIIKEIRKEKPNGKIIIAGHSMGGGVALRYAMESQYQQPDGFLLLAPLLGHNWTAFSQVQSTENKSEEAAMKIHVERIIGLTMLNEIGNHHYDSLPVLFFNLPQGFPLRKYSYRANKSMTPDDYTAGLKSVKAPMLVLIGSDDEVFSAEAMQKAVLENSNGTMKIIDSATHNGIRHNPQSFTFIKDWYSKL